MAKNVSRIGLALGVAALAVGAATPRAQAGDAASSTKPSTLVLWPAGDIKWVESPALKGLMIAVLWGDPKTGAYGALKKLPAGTEIAWHTHTSEQKVVMVSGVIHLEVEGGTAQDMGPGSYMFTPGGAKHAAHADVGKIPSGKTHAGSSGQPCRKPASQPDWSVAHAPESGVGKMVLAYSP